MKKKISNNYVKTFAIILLVIALISFLFNNVNWKNAKIITPLSSSVFELSFDGGSLPTGVYLINNPEIVNGIINKAIKFEESKKNYVKISKDFIEMNQKEFSISVWVDVTSKSSSKTSNPNITTNRIVSKGNVFSLRIDERENWTNAILFDIWYNNTKSIGLGSKNIIKFNEWHYITAVYKFSNITGKSTIKIYIDGKLNSYNNISWQVSKNITDSNKLSPIYLSNRAGSNIMIDEFEIYNRELSDYEINRKYHEGATSVPFKTFIKHDIFSIFNKAPWNSYSGSTWNINLTKSMIVSAVDETSGKNIDVFDVELLGWVPFWKSTICCHSFSFNNNYVNQSCINLVEMIDGFYCAKQYDLWYRQLTGKLNVKEGYSCRITKFLFNGTRATGYPESDMLAIFINQTKNKGMLSAVSMRLNDVNVLMSGNSLADSCFVSQFYYEHPDYKITNGDYSSIAQNWEYEPVRKYKLQQIKDIIKYYNSDIIVLDFMRFPTFFNKDFPIDKRKEIMYSFIKDTRDYLDKNSIGGRYRYLGIRISPYMDVNDQIGIPLDGLKGKVDYIIVEQGYPIVQDTEISKINDVSEKIPVFYEFGHAVAVWNIKSIQSKYVNKNIPIHIKNSVAQVLTSAYLAYEQGATGIGAFNMQYSREYGNFIYERGPFREPVFEVFKYLKDKNFLYNFSSQHYFIERRSAPKHAQDAINLPVKFKNKMTKTFKFHIIKPKDGWDGDAVLRILADERMDDKNIAWTAKLNGVYLNGTANVANPFNDGFNYPISNNFEGKEFCHKYSGCWKAWNVPLKVFNKGNGINEYTLELTLQYSEIDLNITYIDLYFKSNDYMELAALNNIAAVKPVSKSSSQIESSKNNEPILDSQLFSDG